MRFLEVFSHEKKCMTDQTFSGMLLADPNYKNGVANSRLGYHGKNQQFCMKG